MHPLICRSGSDGLQSRDCTGKAPLRKVTTRSEMLVMGDIPVDTHGAPPHTGGAIAWEEPGRDVSETDMMGT
jgi:hypothetical protein